MHGRTRLAPLYLLLNDGNGLFDGPLDPMAPVIDAFLIP